MDFDSSYIMLLVIFLLLGCAAADDVNYNVKTSIMRPLLPNIPVSLVIDATERIMISQINSTTTSLAIKWKFLHNFNGTHKETIVGYVVRNTNGRFLSDNLGVMIDQFEFRHLQPDTTYSVCVEMIENSSLSRTVSHFKCVNMSTIPSMRIDSIVAMIITIGYLVFMGIVGCAVWKRRVRNNNRIRLEDDDVDESSTVRWKDIEEKQRLNSIDDSVDV